MKCFSVLLCIDEVNYFFSLFSVLVINSFMKLQKKNVEIPSANDFIL